MTHFHSLFIDYSPTYIFSTTENNSVQDELCLKGISSSICNKIHFKLLY